MSREDAELRGLHDGQMVEVHNARGSLTIQLAVSGNIHRGVVALPGKWWNADVGPRNGVNDLTSAAISAGGQPAYNETFVEVRTAQLCTSTRSNAR